LRIGHVADELPQGQGEFLDERRGGNDLLSLGDIELLVDVDHIEFVAARQVLFTEFPDIVDGQGSVAAFSNSSVLVCPLFRFIAVAPKWTLFRGDRTNVESHQHALGVGQISDNLLDRLGKLPDQRRDGNDLIPLGKLGIL